MEHETRFHLSLVDSIFAKRKRVLIDRLGELAKFERGQQQRLWSLGISRMQGVDHLMSRVSKTHRSCLTSRQSEVRSHFRRFMFESKKIDA